MLSIPEIRAIVNLTERLVEAAKLIECLVQQIPPSCLRDDGTFPDFSSIANTHRAKFSNAQLVFRAWRVRNWQSHGRARPSDQEKEWAANILVTGAADLLRHVPPEVARKAKGESAFATDGSAFDHSPVSESEAYRGADEDDFETDEPRETDLTCIRCGGMGVVYESDGFYRVQKDCPECRGSGFIPGIGQSTRTQTPTPENALGPDRQFYSLATFISLAALFVVGAILSGLIVWAKAPQRPAQNRVAGQEVRVGEAAVPVVRKTNNDEAIQRQAVPAKEIPNEPQKNAADDIRMPPVPASRKTRIQVLGREIEAASVVFVCSAYSYRGEPWNEMRAEVVNAIEALPEHMSFQVLFGSQKRSDGKVLLPASKEMKARVKDTLRLSPGESVFDQLLAAAFSLRPDVVLLFTNDRRDLPRSDSRLSGEKAPVHVFFWSFPGHWQNNLVDLTGKDSHRFEWVKTLAKETDGSFQRFSSRPSTYFWGDGPTVTVGIKAVTRGFPARNYSGELMYADEHEIWVQTKSPWPTARFERSTLQYLRVDKSAPSGGVRHGVLNLLPKGSFRD